MSEILPEEIDHLAKLARLTLTSEEKTEFAQQLPAIIGFVDQLDSAAKLSGEGAIAAPVALANLREDKESGVGLTTGQLERLAPAWRDGQLEVPAVFGEVADE